MKTVLSACIVILVIGSVVLAEKAQLKAEVVGHDSEESHHDKHEGHDNHEKDKDHNHKEAKASHDEHGEHGNESEENPQVGEGKGITVASAEDGIKLSSEAIKNFEIKTIKISNLNSISVSKKAIVTAGDEVNLFRVRDGFYKRIDFDILRKEGVQIMIKSKELKLNDEIVVYGMGFLRIAEIAAFGGAPEGHSH